jgi:hypothetical protein
MWGEGYGSPPSSICGIIVLIVVKETTMNFKDMPIRELREYAKTNGIKLQSATKKADIVAILEATEAPSEEITFDAEPETPSVVTAPTEDARAAREEEEIARRLEEQEVDANKPTAQDDKVCVYSERRYSSSKLGKLDLGYNIVKKDLAVMWVRLPDVRAASKDELARAQASGIKPGQLVGPKGRRM